MKSTISCISIFFLSIVFAFSQQSANSQLKLSINKSKFGFVNEKNKLKVKYKYSFAEPFSEGLALVAVYLKFGYINSNDEFVILPVFQDAGSFSDGCAYFSKDLLNYGYINKDGNILIEPKFAKASDFKNGYAIVQKLNPDTAVFGKQKYLEGLIDKSGSLIGNQWFSSVDYPEVGVAGVSIKENYFLLNVQSGELQIKEKELANEAEDNVEDGMPEFPGGERGLMNYVASTVRYPNSARENDIQGKVYVRFIVTTTGKTDKIRIARSVHPVLDKEALRVVRGFPEWKPGIQNGKPVNVWYTIPINFQLD